MLATHLSPLLRVSVEENFMLSPRKRKTARVKYKSNRTIESVSSLIAIVNKMEILEIAITSTKEKFETQLQDLEEEHTWRKLKL